MIQVFLKKELCSFVHEGKKQFQCNVCNTSFSRTGHLKGHIESVHEGKKPFKCNNCDASFSQKGHLNVHIESAHRRLKPFNVAFKK